MSPEQIFSIVFLTFVGLVALRIILPVFFNLIKSICETIGDFLRWMGLGHLVHFLRRLLGLPVRFLRWLLSPIQTKGHSASDKSSSKSHLKFLRDRVWKEQEKLDELRRERQELEKKIESLRLEKGDLGSAVDLAKNRLEALNKAATETKDNERKERERAKEIWSRQREVEKRLEAYVEKMAEW